MAPLLSIIIRTHNAEAYLPELIDSIYRQDFKDWEIIAVLHKCHDGSEAILREAGAKIVHYPPDDPFNYSRALNIGSSVSRGKYLLNLSCHVKFVKANTISRMLANMEINKFAAISVRRRFPREPYSQNEGLDVTNIGNFEGWGGLANYCGMIPKSLWLQQPFHEAIPTVEDCAWAAYWICRGHQTAVLRGHSVLYRNPQYSVYKLFRDRAFIALFLARKMPSDALMELSNFLWNNATKLLRFRYLEIWPILWIEICASWKLRILSKSRAKQESLRLQMLREYPNLVEYIETNVSMAHPEPTSPTNL